ncbi:MAG: glyoxylase-like metal-dependent hydrolase (beta-lactamase superfamily II) [Myxococcota bacterium]
MDFNPIEELHMSKPTITAVGDVMKAIHPLRSALVLLAIAGCTAGTGGDDTGSTSLVQSPLEQAVDAIGGQEALTGLERLRIEASGSRRIDYEGMTPSDIQDASTYTSTYLHDLATDDLRVDMTRNVLFDAFQFFPEESYSVVLNGEVGGVTAPAGFSPPGAMPSQHVGALRQQQRFFNPHVLLRAALSDPAASGDGGEATYDDRPHRILTLQDGGVELRLFVDAETGLISKLATMENSPLFRDVPIEVLYTDWQVHGTLAVPGRVELYAVEGLVHEEVRTTVDVEPTDVSADAFELPAEAGTPEVDTDRFEFGRQSHQVVEAFFLIVFGYDSGGTVQTSELAPGVMLLGAAHNSVAVVVDGNLVVLEAPITPEHGTAIVSSLEAEFPGMPITHVIQSHHHQDHSAGVRSLADAGATVVVGPGVQSFYEDVLAAPSTLRPDALSRSQSPTAVEEIAANGTTVITGTESTVTAYHLSANSHAADMVITLIDTGEARFVYEADLYSAGYGFSVVVGGPEAFMAGLRDFDIIDADCESPVPLTVIPAHGLVQSLEDSIAELDALGLDIGCP